MLSRSDHPKSSVRFTVGLLIARISFFLLLLLSFIYGAEFGKNKVQHEVYQWKTLTTPHFELHFHEGQDSLPLITAHSVEYAYSLLHQQFDFRHRKKIPLLIYGSPNDFQQTNVIMEVLPEGVGGFTEIFKNRVVVPFTGSWSEYHHVLHHELVHAFEFGILFDHFGGSFMRGSGLQLPLWFAEGLAEYLSVGWDSESDMFMMDRTIAGSIPSVNQLSGYMVYKGGQSFLYFLSSAWGSDTFKKFLRTFVQSRNVELSLKEVYGQTSEELSNEWIKELRRIYWPEIGNRSDPARFATAITNTPESRSQFNLRPRLSPSGDKIAYFSDYKDRTRIVISDRKGKILADIPQYGYGGFFESFHPMRSGLAWSPEGNKLAFVTKHQGRDEIRIVEIGTKKLLATIVPPVRSVRSPDWSPDGKHIVFAGIESDRSDIFLYSFAQDSIVRLTNDIRHESDPTFSRDGMSIVFAGEDSLRENPPGSVMPRPTFDLFMMSIDDGTPRRLAKTPWDETEPRFSPDGSHLIFVSNQNGINNLYVGAIDSLQHSRSLTDIVGGCSSPDWSSGDSSVCFSLFQNQKWHIWTVENPYELLTDSVPSPTQWMLSRSDSTFDFFRRPPETKSAVEQNSATTTTADSTTDTTDTIVSSDSTAITDSLSRTVTSPNNREAHSLSPDSAHAPTDSTDANALTLSDSQRYRLKLSPDMIAMGVAVNAVYGYAGQGVIVLSDLLGNHRFTFAADIRGRLDEYAHLFGSYLSLKHRVNFGLGAFFSRDYTYIDQYYHDTNLGGLFLLQYPFSQNMRTEFNTYYSNVLRVPFSEETEDNTDSTDSAEGSSRFNILLPSLSLVFDNILWGITGPITGVRANASLLLSPPVASIEKHFIAAEVDFRSYSHIRRRFVWANRIAVGGSLPLGKDGQSARRYFLGGSENWIFSPRDVDLDNYVNNRENAFYSEMIVPFRGWDYFDMTGTRFAVVNSEFRFPFIREITVVWPLPLQIRYINGALFVDAGNVWDREDQRNSLPLPSALFGGIGYGFRANLGIFVLRFDRAWKTDWKNYLDSPKNYFSLGAEF